MMQLAIKSMDVTLNLNGITSVIGPCKSGKTTLLKKIINKVSNDDVYIDDELMSNYDITFLKNNFMVVFDDSEFKTEYVAEELNYYLSKLGYNFNECVKKIESLSKDFKIEHLLNERIDTLRLVDKVFIKILSFLIVKPKVLGIDELLCYLSKSRVNMIIDYIKNNNITLINVTSNSEHLLISDYVIVMSNFKALMCVDAYNVLNGNSILPYLGIKLPFVVDLSNNLMIYDIVSKVEFDNRELVDKIWK